MFEPYAVFPRRLVPDVIMFDERFVGRGFNKQSFFFELWASGARFAVLRDAFVVDQPNPSPPTPQDPPSKALVEAALT